MLKKIVYGVMFLCLAFVVWLVICFVGAPIRLKNEAYAHYKKVAYKRVPVINKHSKHFIDFTICKDKSIHKPIHIKFETLYMTTNQSNDCMGISNFYEGAYYDQSKTLSHRVILPADKQCVEKKVPLDEIEPGFCRWRVSDGSYKLLPFDKDMGSDGEYPIAQKSKCTKLAVANYVVSKSNKILTVKYKPDDFNTSPSCPNMKFKINIKEVDHA